MTPVARIYEKYLMDNGIVSAEKVAEMKSIINKNLEESYAKSKDVEYKAEDWVTKEWA